MSVEPGINMIALFAQMADEDSVDGTENLVSFNNVIRGKLKGKAAEVTIAIDPDTFKAFSMAGKYFPVLLPVFTDPFSNPNKPILSLSS